MVADLPLDNTIRLMVQDSVGFIWMGYFGLKRYDGQEFIQYRHDPQNNNCISDENINDLYVDSKKRLWVSVNGGLDRYIYTRDYFRHYYFTDDKGDTIPYNVFSLAEDTSGNLYAGLNFGVKKNILEDGVNRLRQLTGKGVYRLDVENEKFVALDYVNRVLDTLYRQHFVEDINHPGIYETTIVFPAGHFNSTLRYAFSIFRKNGTVDQENFPDMLGNNNEKRIIKLTHNRIELPIIRFNESVETSDIKYSGGQDIKHNIEVCFRIDLTNLKRPIEKGDYLRILGDLFPLGFGRQSGYLKRISFDQNNNLWLANNPVGMFVFDLQKNSYHQFIFNPYASEINGNNSITFQSNQINDLFIAKNGNVWIATWGGLHRYIPGQDTIISYYNNPSDNNGPFYNETLSLTEDASGNLWIGNFKESVSVFNPMTEQFYQIKDNILSGKNAILIDKSANVWLGGDNQGVNKIITNKPHFETHEIPFKDKIFSLYEDSAGAIWIGGENEVIKYNRKTKETKTFKQPKVRKFYQDKNGTLWMCSATGLFYLRLNTNTLNHFLAGSTGYSEALDLVSDLCEVDGNFWITSGNGYLSRINLVRKEYKSYYIGGLLFEIASDSEGSLWFIGEKGLVKFDPKTEKFEIVDENGAGINLRIAPNGTIWYSGQGSRLGLGGRMFNFGKGLNAYNPQTKKITKISTEDGLLTNSVMGMELDNSGNVWVSTKKGLSRYDPLTKSFRHYINGSGLELDDFLPWAEYKNNRGEIFFAMNDGFVVFHPDSLDKQNYIPNVIFKKLKINNKLINTAYYKGINQSIFTLKELKLDYNQNDISFSFASLDYTFPEKNKYTYMLENYDDNWRQESTDNKAYYTNLDPGEYIFKVKGSNSYGAWNEDPTKLKITILPPWWTTWWAYSLYVIFTLFIIYVLRSYELNRQRLKYDLKMEHFEAEKLREVDNLKSRFFASISHEFRTPLTLIRGPLERLLKKTSDNSEKADLKRIENNAARMNKLVEMYLDLSQMENGNLQIQKEKGDIIQTLKSVIASFESMARAAGINIQFHTTIESAICRVDREKFEMILINLLSNAIKFMPVGGEITVDIGVTPLPSPLTKGGNRGVQITVSDTGIGIPEDKQVHIFDMYYQVDNAINKRISGTGIGLAMVKELVELHDGQITVESKQGEGTTFTIHMPLISYSEIGEKPKLKAVKESTGQKETELVESPEEKDQDKELILIVEDNHQMRDYIKSHLENNYYTQLAANGKQGFDSALKNNPTLIISDVMMPEMDGYEFCEKIKNDLRTSHIPVILLTAKAGEQDMFSGLEKGADNYLKKPFKAEELLLRIKNLIDNRKRLHKKFQNGQYMNLDDYDISSADEAFLKKCLQIIEKNLSNADFSIEQFANIMALSRRHLYRKLKALTGLSTNKYIQTIRLKKSIALLSANSENISQIAYNCGFSNPSYFAEAFREMFDLSPTEYLKKLKM